ncbi:MAG: hypothetical protein BWX92_03380 [Deltaproteobacteria bacterium ADurb.Bin135]|nr:MAG: hypothetical protein BWX92_03380 [Deltaproteobacteria bacterium ADurb.Bin135]
MSSIFNLGISKSEKETYLTRVFAYMLNKDPQFTKYVFKELFHRSIDQIISVIPEYTIPSGRRPDIVVHCIEDSKKKMIAIENKIAAGFTDNQIDEYKSEFGENNVYLIYKYISDISQATGAAGQCSWYNIYHLSKLYSSSVSVEPKKFLALEFKNYLEDIGMGIDVVKKDLLSGLESYNNLCRQIDLCMNELCTEKAIDSYKLTGSIYYRNWVMRKSNMQLTVTTVPFRVLTNIFSRGDLTTSNLKRVPDVIPDLSSGWYYNWFIDDFKNINEFLEMSLEDQLSTLKNFIKGSIMKYNSIGLGDQPEPPESLIDESSPGQDGLQK